jgi:membrane protein required for colicin V production
MQGIDIFFAVLIVVMAIHGFVKGFIEELFSRAAPILAIWAAVLLFSAGGLFIRERFMQNIRLIPEILAFIAIFVLVMLFVKMLGGILRSVVEGIHLGTVNKLLGVVFGLIEGIALTALILFILSVQPLFNASKLVGDSIFAQYLLPFIKIPLEHGKDIINTVLYVLPCRGRELV